MGPLGKEVSPVSHFHSQMARSENPCCAVPPSVVELRLEAIRLFCFREVSCHPGRPTLGHPHERTLNLPHESEPADVALVTLRYDD